MGSVLLKTATNAFKLLTAGVVIGIVQHSFKSSDVPVNVEVEVDDSDSIARDTDD